MKEEDSNPLEPVGDEPIEARIVAWVLGDASAFEAAELERLCEERPELLVFRHRMQALHGLLTEAEEAQPDEAWKLPAAKREKIEALFSAMHEPAPVVALKPKRAAQPWIRQALMATAACLVLAAGFRYVFAPAKDARAHMAANESVGTMSARKPSLAFWAGRDLPVAEGYASNKPVLPEIADADEERLTRSELVPDRPMGGGLKAGGSTWNSSSGGAGGGVGGALADNSEPESSARSRSKASPAKSAPAAPMNLAAQRSAARGVASQMPFGVPATPPPVTAAPAAPEAKPAAAIASTSKSDDTKVTDIVIGGLRSGDAAITRNNIDGILNGQNQVAGDKGGAAIGGGLRRDLSQELKADGKMDLAKNEITTKDARRAGLQTDFFDAVDAPAQPSSGPALEETAKGKKASLDLAWSDREELGLAGEVASGGPERTRSLESKDLAMGDRQTRNGPPAAARDSDSSGLDDMGRLAPKEQPQAVLAAAIPAADLLEQEKAMDRAPADPFAASSAKDERRLFSPRPAAQTAAPEEQTGVLTDGIAPTKRMESNLPTEHGLAVNGALNADSTSVEGVKKALQEQEQQLAQATDRLSKLRTLSDAKQGEALERSIDSTDYLRAKTDLETAQDTLKEAKGNLVKDKIKVSTDGKNLSDAEKTASDANLRSLSKVVQDQEDKVEEKRKLLTNIVRTKGIILTGQESAYRTEINEDDREASGIRETANKLEQEKIQLETKVSTLKKQLAAAETARPTPPKPAPVPTDETVAAAEPFSTFSLHVSDASFKLAKAALDRGERLSPDQIRTEEFYNAFDYGDPAPAPGEPVACTIEQAAHPVLPQRNIVRVAMRVGSAGRGQGQPLNLTLLLDNSGSMEREDRHEGLKAAIAQLATLLQPGDTVTLAGFSRTPHLLADRLSGAESGKLVELVDKLPSEGGTNLEEALKLAGELAVQRKNPAAQNRIVLLTDGAANLGNAQPDDLANKVAELRQQGIAFDAAGIGAGGLNDRMLEALTRHGNGRYYIVNDPKDADANFAKQLAGAFRPAAENVKVQVHFNPDRVSHYKLIGFEKHRLNTEDFHNDAVDAAELAADEAGVALYQVETIPDGSGEIGELSVRFRDTAAGHMVENTWTIPHDEKTPAFDQARPSIQLATLSMLAAEKLRGGPLAEATDFTTLSPVISRVKNYYNTSSRVGELTDMTGKLR